MTATDVLELSRESVWLMLKVGGPILIVALIVGLSISLIQALTQVQEMTLSFVPKILAIFAALVLLMPFMLTTLTDFTKELMDRAIALG